MRPGTGGSLASTLKLCSLLGLVGALTFSPSAARAQSSLEGFRLDRFQPAPSLNDGLALQLPSTLGHLVPSLQIVGDYAHEPLLTRGFGTDPGDVEIVGRRVSAYALAALGLSDRAELFVRLPVTLYQSGESPRAGGRVFDEPDSAGLGDLSLGGSVRLLGKQDTGSQLGLHASLSLPSGSEAALAGDGGVGAQGTLSFAHISRHVTLALESGVTYRPERQYGFGRLGTEWLYRAGLYVPVGASSKLMFELDGATRILDGQLFERDARPLEALAGARVHLGHGVYGSLAGGLGLLSAPGVPLVRGVLGLGWSPFAGQEEEPAPAPVEASPEPEPEKPSDPDEDRDGVSGASDLCPSSPEDADNFEDSDGCPDDDNDRDGVADPSDTCPNAAEDLDGDDDEDGCPESAIGTPSTPEPVEASPEPSPAASGDGPAPLDVHFDKDQFGVSGRTRQELRAALAWFARHPGTYTVRIEGHASAEGSDQRNEELAEWRAAAAARYIEKHSVWLRQHGARLNVQASGRGSREPIAPNDTEEGRQKNRRVEFEVTSE